MMPAPIRAEVPWGRFNPIHLVIRDGADVAADTMMRDFSGADDRHLRGTHDVLIMLLPSGTHGSGIGMRSAPNAR